MATNALKYNFRNVTVTIVNTGRLCEGRYSDFCMIANEDKLSLTKTVYRMGKKT